MAGVKVFVDYRELFNQQKKLFHVYLRKPMLKKQSKIFAQSKVQPIKWTNKAFGWKDTACSKSNFLWLHTISIKTVNHIHIAKKELHWLTGKKSQLAVMNPNQKQSTQTIAVSGIVVIGFLHTKNIR